MLELPKTIRTPREDEIHLTQDVKDLLEERKIANIVQGYKLSYNKPPNSLHNFYACININNSRLWELFIALAKVLPDHVGTIYNVYEEAPHYGNYLPKAEVINAYALYKSELMQDGSLEFGIIYHVEDKLEEIFIPEAKYIKFWGVNEPSFRQIMNDFHLEEIEDLRFIDEFPKAVEALTLHDPNAKETREIIEELDHLFQPKPLKRNWKFWKK